MAWTSLGTSAGVTSEVSRATGAETTLTSNLATTNCNLANAIIVLPVNSYTAAHTLSLTDQGFQVEVNATGAVVVTVPAFATVAFPTRTLIPWIAAGAGQVTFTPASGVTLHSATGTFTSRTQWSEGTLLCRNTNEWVLAGDTT